MALSRGEIRVVQSILLGSILSDILLASSIFPIYTYTTNVSPRSKASAS